MSELLNNLMLQDNDEVSSEFYRLPNVLEMTSENPIINFDKGKKDSYLFYVENPIQEQIGYRKDLKVFVIKANPYTTAYNKEDGQHYDDLNIIDGDTMYFDIDSIVDTNTEFMVGDKRYSGFKAFLDANNQWTLSLRLLGLDCPEIVHYKEIPVLAEKASEYETTEKFGIAMNKSDVYIMSTLDRNINDTVRFFKTSENLLEIVGEPYPHEYDTNLLVYKVVSKNDTLGAKQEYIDEGINCKNMLIDLLNRAKDIRLVLDQQSLNRKPSSYGSPYDKLEHLTDEGILTKTYAFINALWDEYLSHTSYPYRGFNAPGLDTYGRSLGEIYVKVFVPELQADTWVNAAKYILYHNDKYTKAVPAYTSDPTEVYHNNFLSSAFKLNTYDKRYKDIIDGFTHATTELIDERNQWYSKITGLDIAYIQEHTVILGDTILMVPPMSIRSVTETNHTKIPLLRSKGAIVKSLPRSQKILELDVYFNNENGINGAPYEFTGKDGVITTYYMNGLRSLIAQFKLTPFIPIENNYINDALLVDAVTLININVQTVPNYPRCLKATLTLAEFNYSIFMPELPEHELYNTFSQTIHYPAMRWYYQRLLANGEAIRHLEFNSEEYITKAYGSRTALVPMDFKSSRMTFYIPDKSQLETRLEIMMDPRPILTQEQLTEEMTVGAKRLAPLIKNIQELSSHDALHKSIDALLSKQTFTPYSPILASTELNKEAEILSINVPLFTAVKLGESDIKSGIINKIAIRYVESYGYTHELYLMDYTDKATVWNIAESLFDDIIKALQEKLGLFGGINVYTRTEGQQLFIGAIVPLPAELAQSSYEVRMIAQKISSQFNINAGELENLIRYTDMGAMGVPVEIVLDIEKWIKTEDGEVDIYKIVDSERPFSLNVNGLGLRVLDYLYAIASDETDSGLGDSVEQFLIDEKRDTVLNEAMGLRFLKYETGDMIIEQIGVSYSNTFSNMTLNMIDGKAFQYTGAQDINLQVSLVTKSKFTIDALTYLPELSAEYARNYRQVLNCWPLRIDCELSKLFGVMEVLIENVQTETIPNQPELTRITLTLSSVDRTVRQKEALSKIDTETTNAGYINYGNKGRAEIKTYFDLKHSLAKAEIYPDLELPTVDELHNAGFELYRNKSIDINKAQRTYVDPDFYFVYGHALACEIFRDNFINAFEQDIGYDLTDKEGAYTRYIYKKSGEESYEQKNSVAISQRDFYTGAFEAETEYTYKDMSREVYKALRDKNKNVFKLGQTLAELGTPFWDMTSEVKLPFAESVIDLMPEVVVDDYEKKKNALIKAIDDFLSVSIEENLPKHFDETINPGTKHKTQANRFESICADIGTELCQSAIVKEMLMLSEEELDLRVSQTVSVKDFLESRLSLILLAYADAFAGESYYTNQTVAILEDYTADKTYSWKAKQYMNTDKNNPVPYARVYRDGAVYASSIDDAIKNGYGFGPFNILLRKGDTLTDIHKDKVVHKDKQYFLDPYYLDLQNNRNTEAIETHKQKLLTLTGYGAIALFRELLVLYRYFLKEGKLLSLYEISRADAMDAYRDHFRVWGSPNANVNIWDEININSAKDAAEKEQVEIINDYIRVLKGLSKALIESDEEREALVTQTLDLEKDTIIGTAIIDIDGSLFGWFGDIKNNKAEDMGELYEYFDHWYQNADINGWSAEKKSRFKYLSEICNNYENVSIIEFAQDMQELMLMFESDNSFSQSHAKQTMQQVYKDEQKMFPGRFLGMAIALIEPQTFIPMIHNKQIDALNHLIVNASRPDVSQENSRLRKFLYALDGRGVLSLSNIGDIPITLEAQYRSYITEKVLIERSEDPRKYLRDSFNDMIENDKRGRMLRAFPTYYMFFVDEGREIGLWQLHDNFYSSSAIAEIEITKSRKIAADTAHIVLSNLFNSYTQDDKDFIYDLDNPFYDKSIRYKVHDAFNALFSPRTYFNQEEIKRLNTPTPLTSRLTPGTRLHIRMGYGANASELPIVFNGQIAEISNGEVCQIVAQGDGVELLNPIQDIQDAADIQHKDSFIVKRFFETWLTNGATPKTILGSILTSRGWWKDKMAENLTNGYLKARNPFGISHFGDIFFDKIFHGSECIQNLFEVNSAALYEKTEKQADDYIGLEKNYKTASTPIISIDVLGKTTWDIGHICASVAPDYKFAVVPFEMRSSLFMGKGRDYYAYAYGIDKSIENTDIIYERRKPFEQYHYYTSYSDIITNNIVANSMNVKTNAIGLYQQTGSWGKVKPKETTRLYVDFDIYPEHQKSTTIDTQLWAQGMPILGNGFFLGTNADTDDDVDDWIPGAAEIAWRMTASGLKQAMKDMYEGELIVMGDPSVKPHDRMLINDLYEHMQGPAWVEAVVHSFNAQTGFTTSLYADCINEIDDRFEKQNDLLTRQAMSSAAAAYLTPVALNQLFFRKNMKRINNVIMEVIIRGGFELESNKAIIANALNGFMKEGKKIDANELKFLENAIKAASTFDYKLNKMPNYKEKNAIMTTISKFTKKFFGEDQFALMNVVLGPFENAGDNFKAITGVKTAKDVAKLFIKNADELDKVSGNKLLTTINSASDSDISAEQIAQLTEDIKVYDDKLNDVIQKTFGLDTEFMENIDELSDFVINSDVDDEVKKYALYLKEFKAQALIKDSEDLRLFGQSLEICASMCDDTKLLKAIASTASEVKDFSQITTVAKSVKKIVPNIDNVVALIGASTGPAGLIISLIYMALEIAISNTIGAYATEALERYLQNLQVMRIYPLSKNNRVLVAGITGHKGLVIGSPTQDSQGAWTEFVTGLFGAKEPDNFVTSTIQFLFTSDKARAIASKYRTGNGLPDVLEHGYDINELQAQFDANFNRRISTLANNNELLNLNQKRYQNIQDALPYFEHYTARSYKNEVGLDKRTQQEFYAIQKHVSIAEHMKIGIFKMAHDFNNTTHISWPIGDEFEKLNVFHEDKLLNVPILRKDTIHVLDMLISKYIEKEKLYKPTLDLEERIQQSELQLTSATIVDAKGYEGTGFVFRITSQNTKALEEAVYELAIDLNKHTHVIDNYECGSDHVICVAIPISPSSSTTVSEVK